ncbi:MAG: M55 family metallopeptidase [Clostridia bacterium]|nr:M55 family metallopeptidase [Clostridia bacterium]
MKIFIAVDMEGISGINCPDYVLKDRRLYPAGQRLMTKDVNAAVAGCFDAGADEVIVADIHSSSGNILVEELDERALLIAGSPYNPRFPFLDRSVDGMFLMGYHAMAGTYRGNLEHTMSSAAWHKFCVNGVPYGEFESDAELAAEAGVPVIFASGDDKLCEEAAAWLPGIETAMVKQGLGRQAALSYSPKRGNEIVYKHAKRAVERLIAGEKFLLPEIPSPAVVTLTYKMVPDADAANVYGTRRIDGYTVETTYERLSQRYGGIWEEYNEKQKIK